MVTEIDPMPMFPTSSVRDVEASARWYEALGFEHVFTMPDAAGRPHLVHLRWTKYADVQLRQGSSPVLEGRDRGVSIADPDGHVLVFTFGPVDAATTFDEVIDRARPA